MNTARVLTNCLLLGAERKAGEMLSAEEWGRISHPVRSALLGSRMVEEEGGADLSVLSEQVQALAEQQKALSDAVAGLRLRMGKLSKREI